MKKLLEVSLGVVTSVVVSSNGLRWIPGGLS